MANYKEKSDLEKGASAVAEETKGMAAAAQDKAREAAATLQEKAESAASFIGAKAQQTVSSVGAGMKQLAGTVREAAPSRGMLGAAGATMADTLESSGRYLQEHDLKGIGDDMTNLIRRNPIPALLIGIGIGFLLARATRS